MLSLPYFCSRMCLASLIPCFESCEERGSDSLDLHVLKPFSATGLGLVKLWPLGLVFNIGPLRMEPSWANLGTSGPFLLLSKVLWGDLGSCFCFYYYSSPRVGVELVDLLH